MNVIWIVADTFRKDHLGAYGYGINSTPSLDLLASRSVRFDRHFAGAFPTMPTRADHATGRWIMSFMGWEPLPDGQTTIAELLAEQGYHTAAVVDTPFYLRNGMNYDRGFQTFVFHPGQDAPGTKDPAEGHKHESQDVRADWRYEADCNSPRTMTNAMEWLEKHYKEKFFLYVDTWDPHEPWDSPAYYTERYWPGYDGEIIDPPYGKWQDSPGYTKETVDKAHATYCGQISMVDTWIGYFLGRVESMGLLEDTVVIFTSDHGFYFGEHGGTFGKMVFDKLADGTVPQHGAEGVTWGHSPLYNELINIPLVISVPGIPAGSYQGLTSAIDVMPTVLDILGHEIPQSVEGVSLLPGMRESSLPGRDFVISTLPFANPGEPVRHVDDLRRDLRASPVTTVTANDWSLLYSMDGGMSELFDLKSDPGQNTNIINRQMGVAKDLHKCMLQFMRDTNVPKHLIDSRLELRA
tara:strand:- start:2930 stop:4324 length:1395 start_codon:yes stop_codon:yes gene_type:complete